MLFWSIRILGDYLQLLQEEHRIPAVRFRKKIKIRGLKENFYWSISTEGKPIHCQNFHSSFIDESPSGKSYMQTYVDNKEQQIMQLLSRSVCISSNQCCQTESTFSVAFYPPFDPLCLATAYSMATDLHH